MAANLAEVSSEDDSKTSSCAMKMVDGTTGEIELLPDGSDTGPHYTLKPLAELFAAGRPGKPVDPQSPAFAPLFMAIEQMIVDFYRVGRQITDADADIALDLLNSDPAGNVTRNPLAHSVQLRLRLLLSVDDYSRDEVRQALRKILKSIRRHTCLSGRWGYLQFIDQYLP